MGERREKIIGIRKRIGELTRYSANTYPQVPAFFDIDMSEMLALKKKLEEENNVRLSTISLTSSTGKTGQPHVKE